MRPRGRVEVGQEQQRGVLEHGAESVRLRRGSERYGPNVGLEA